MSSDAEEMNKIKDQAAASLVKARIDALYQEIQTENTNGDEQIGLVERFWRAHHSHPNPHQAWIEYYNSLSDEDKHRLWREYHIKVANELSNFDHPRFNESSDVSAQHGPVRITGIKHKTTEKSSLAKSFFRSHIKPILSAALVVSFTWLVFNNELVIAKVRQYIVPGDSDLSPSIIDPSVKVGDEPRIIIPKINVDAPVVYDAVSREEAVIQKALERGVVHYSDTGLPGELHNNVIVGHSSNNFFNSGKYKFAFVLLNKLEIGDDLILHYGGVRYVYRVTIKQVVEVNDFSLIRATEKPILTLVTCDPPGTSWRRLIIQGEQISPAPETAKTVDKQIIPIEEEILIPGNSPSLWSRFWSWMF